MVALSTQTYDRQWAVDAFQQGVRELPFRMLDRTTPSSSLSLKCHCTCLAMCYGPPAGNVRTHRKSGPAPGLFGGMSEAGLIALADGYDAIGHHSPPPLPMHLQTHCGTPNKSGYETKIEGTFWCDVNRMDFMMKHVRTNHPSKYQESEGKFVVVLKKHGDEGTLRFCRSRWADGRVLCSHSAAVLHCTRGRFPSSTTWSSKTRSGRSKLIDNKLNGNDAHVVINAPNLY